MAFLAKQFMSLLLLLVISRLILSTHAVRQHFSQFSRKTTTTTDPTDLQPDNYGEATFYENDEKPHGLGNSPPSTTTSFLPSNYDPVMYTTSLETQKNMHTTKNEDQTVTEKLGAYNPFSNSKLDEQYYENYKKPTTKSEDQNQGYNQNNKYDPYGSEYNQRYNQNNEEYKYPTTVPVSQFHQQNNQFQRQYEQNEATKPYDPYGSSMYSQQYIEAEDEEKKKPTNMPKSYKHNPFQRAYDKTDTNKQSNSKFNEHYANEDAELDAFLNDPENKKGDWETWQAHGQKQQEKYNNKYADSETYGDTKKSANNEWHPAYHRNQKQHDDEHFAMTDAELNAMLDEEEKQGENEIEPESLGMSDTRLDTNEKYYQPTFNWKDVNVKAYANPFSGNALAYAAQNNP